MMTEDEHFLLCLSEEADEVGQRVSKALRFGLAETQAGQPLNNAERIVEEVKDLIAVAHILKKRGQIPAFLPTVEEVTAKEARIRKFMVISREQGVLETEPSSGQDRIAQLEEIADGAWGDGPMTRGLARDELKRLRGE